MDKTKGIALLRDKRGMLLLILLAAAGIGLLLFGGQSEPRKTAPVPQNNFSEVEYIEEIENKIKYMVEKITGEDAYVIVTAESGEEYVYAQNVTVSGAANSGEYVFSPGDDAPVLLKTLRPRLRGIAVVCAGGDDPILQNKIIGLLTSAYGISSNRVYVSGKS